MKIAKKLVEHLMITLKLGLIGGKKLFNRGGMSSQNTQKLLNELILELQSKAKKNLNFNLFYARLGLHFEDIFKKFQRLYGVRVDFQNQLKMLVKALMKLYTDRPEELKNSM